MRFLSIGLIKNLLKFPGYPGRILFPDTKPSLASYRLIVMLLNPLEIYKRRIEKNKIKPEPDPVIIDGYGLITLTSQLKSKITSFAKNIDVDYYEKDETRKKSFLKTYSQDPLSNDLKPIVLADEIIDPIAEYFGSIPVLVDAAVWYSNAKSIEPGRSQLFHLDGGDLKQMKVFIPLEDITEDTGPLTLIDSRRSKNIFTELCKTKRITKINTKLADDEIMPFVSPEHWVKATANVGEAIFTDTSSCYHFGSRPGKKHRLLLMLHFHTFGAVDLPIFSGRKDPTLKALPLKHQLVLGSFNKSFSRIRSRKFRDIYAFGY